MASHTKFSTLLGASVFDVTPTHALTVFLNEVRRRMADQGIGFVVARAQTMEVEPALFQRIKDKSNPHALPTNETPLANSGTPGAPSLEWLLANKQPFIAGPI